MIELSKGGDRDTEINSIHFIHWQIDRKSFVRATQVDWLCPTTQHTTSRKNKSERETCIRPRYLCARECEWIKRRKRLISHNSRDFQLMNCSNKIDLFLSLRFLFLLLINTQQQHTRQGRQSWSRKQTIFFSLCFFFWDHAAKVYHQASHLGLNDGGELRVDSRLKLLHWHIVSPRVCVMLSFGLFGGRKTDFSTRSHKSLMWLERNELWARIRVYWMCLISLFAIFAF